MAGNKLSEVKEQVGQKKFEIYPYLNQVSGGWSVGNLGCPPQ